MAATVWCPPSSFFPAYDSRAIILRRISLRGRPSPSLPAARVSNGRNRLYWKDERQRGRRTTLRAAVAGSSASAADSASDIPKDSETARSRSLVEWALLGWGKLVSAIFATGSACVHPAQSYSDFVGNNIVGNFQDDLVASVGEWEPYMQSLSDVQLAGLTDEFRSRLQKGETLEDILIEAFATVREAARRAVGLRHFDVQIIGGAVLHSGAVAEMPTGEGKTLVATLPSYLNALPGKGVHVLTTNDYLAKRDADWMGKIHRFLGLTVGVIQANMSKEAKQQAYRCDITYSNHQELVFDYLRDQLVSDRSELVLRWPDPLNFCIVDEVDSILIDEAQNPLLISAKGDSFEPELYMKAAELAHQLVPHKASKGSTHNSHGDGNGVRKRYDYVVERQEGGAVELTEQGITRGDAWFAGMEQVAPAPSGDADEVDSQFWIVPLLDALHAKEILERDVHYVVRGRKIVLVDQSTGRLVANRKLGAGRHPALQAKEAYLAKLRGEEPVKLEKESLEVAQTTSQSFYSMYKKLSGMTGTAKTEEAYFMTTYGLPVVQVPPHLPSKREDLSIRMFMNLSDKHYSASLLALSVLKSQLPVLIGTSSVEESEMIWDALVDVLEEARWNGTLTEDVTVNILNAKPENAAREAEIVAQAGRQQVVTIATNMAGRGTDIVLGGNAPMLAKQVMHEVLQLAENADAAAVPRRPDARSVVPGHLKVISLRDSTLDELHRVLVHYDGSMSTTWHEQSLQKAEDLATRYDEEQMRSLAEVKERASRLAAWPVTLALAYRLVLEDCRAQCAREAEVVRNGGGLFVIGTSLHPSRRIDNQLRGRAGRQGDPGKTVFMISLEDAMFQISSLAMLRPIFQRMEENQGDIFWDNRLLEKQLAELQAGFERTAAEQRERITKYDAIMELQRKHVWALRMRTLQEPLAAVHQQALGYMQASIDRRVALFSDPQKHPKEWDLESLLANLGQLSKDSVHKWLPAFLRDVTPEQLMRFLEELEGREVRRRQEEWAQEAAVLRAAEMAELPIPERSPVTAHEAVCGIHLAQRLSNEASRDSGPHAAAQLGLRRYLGLCLMAYYAHLSPFPLQRADRERHTMLYLLDTYHVRHIRRMYQLRTAISLRGYGRLDPLEEFNIETTRAFLTMLEGIRHEIVEVLIKQAVDNYGDYRRGTPTGLGLQEVLK